MFDPINYPQPQAFKNFLFTSVRNALSNHVYHNYNTKKELLSEVIPEISVSDEPVLSISIKSIQEFIKKSIFNIKFNILYTYLNYLGYPVEYDTSCMTSLSGFNENFYNKIVCLFIHDYFNNL